VAAVSGGGAALPFLRRDERPAAPAWLPQSRQFRWPEQRQGLGLNRYQDLCHRLETFTLLPGASRQGKLLHLPLACGPLVVELDGTASAEFLSSEHGEAQRHLRAQFHLPGAWRLAWHLQVGLDLARGEVRLVSATWIEPGFARSFRHIIAARALRRALERLVHPSFGPEFQGPRSRL